MQVVAQPPPLVLDGRDQPGAGGDEAGREISTEKTSTTTRPAFGTRAKVGMVIVGLLGLIDCFSTLLNGDGGPPDPVFLIDTALGVVTVVAIVIGWRTRRRGALRIAAGARVLSAITALPAFFVPDVPPGWVAVAAAFTIVTLVGVVMMLSPERRAAPRR